MNSSDFDSAAPELSTFVSALKRIFHDEPWEQVETYAERAWRACGLEEDASWSNVRDSVRAEWPHEAR